MRRCVSIAVFAILLSTGRTAFADSIAVGDTLDVLNDGGAIYGGVFQVDNLATGAPIDLFTFCVQLAQDISSTDLFTVGDISLIADDDGGPDPLDTRTAWIYSQYRLGTLGAYTENEIQSAIWVIEDEWTFAEENIFFPGMEPGLQNNASALIAAAQHAVDVDGWVNTDVRVLNLFFLEGDRKGDVAQDLLMLSDGGETTQDVHAPEPATLLLVGSGAAALIRRRAKGRRNG